MHLFPAEIERRGGIVHPDDPVRNIPYQGVEIPLTVNDIVCTCRTMKPAIFVNKISPCHRIAPASSPHPPRAVIPRPYPAGPVRHIRLFLPGSRNRPDPKEYREICVPAYFVFRTYVLIRLRCEPDRRVAPDGCSFRPIALVHLGFKYSIQCPDGIISRQPISFIKTPAMSEVSPVRPDHVGTGAGARRRRDRRRRGHGRCWCDRRRWR